MYYSPVGFNIGLDVLKMCGLNCENILIYQFKHSFWVVKRIVWFF